MVQRGIEISFNLMITTQVWTVPRRGPRNVFVWMNAHVNHIIMLAACHLLSLCFNQPRPASTRAAAQMRCGQNQQVLHAVREWVSRLCKVVSFLNSRQPEVGQKLSWHTVLVDGEGLLWLHPQLRQDLDLALVHAVGLDQAESQVPGACEGVWLQSACLH